MLRVVERAMVHIYGPPGHGSIGGTTESGQKGWKDGRTERRKDLRREDGRTERRFHPERSEGSCRFKSEPIRARSLAALGMKSSFRPSVSGPSALPHGYQFAPNCSRVVVVFLMPGMSPWFPFAFRCPILPIPTLTPPSSASLGETKYCSPPVTPPPRPDTERGSCCPVARSTSVVLSFRRATHAPTYGIALLPWVGKLRWAPASRCVRPKFPSTPVMSLPSLARSSPA